MNPINEVDVPSFPVNVAGRDGEGVVLTSGATELKGREWKAPTIGEAMKLFRADLQSEYAERSHPTPAWVKNARKGEKLW